MQASQIGLRMMGVNMGSLFEIDVQAQTLRATISGQITDSELRECYELAREYAARAGVRSAILDLSAVTSAPISADVLLRISESAPTLPDPAIRVIVAPSNHMFGLARMFQILGEKTRHSLHVVHKMEEAYALVGITSPQFGPLPEEIKRSA